MSGLQIKLALAALALAAALYGGWRVTDLVAAGRVSRATEAYNQETRDAADAVAEARARVRACHGGGGVWDRATGQCVRSLSGARQ